MVELAGLEVRRRDAEAMSFSSVAMKRRRAGAGKGKLLDFIRRLLEERGALFAGSSLVLHEKGGVTQSYSRCASGRECASHRRRGRGAARIGRRERRLRATEGSEWGRFAAEVSYSRGLNGADDQWAMGDGQ